jgi:hypothetical protein
MWQGQLTGPQRDSGRAYVTGARERQRREAYQNAVEYLCVNLDELGTLVADPRWADGLKALRSGQPLSAAWCAAVSLLHGLVDDAGVPGGLGLTTPMGAGWPSGPVPRTKGWVCPGRACSRAQLADGGEPLPRTDPRCELLGRAMRFVGD